MRKFLLVLLFLLAISPNILTKTDTGETFVRDLFKEIQHQAYFDRYMESLIKVGTICVPITLGAGFIGDETTRKAVRACGVAPLLWKSGEGLIFYPNRTYAT